MLAVKLDAPNARSVWFVWDDNGVFVATQDVIAYGKNAREPKGFGPVTVLHNAIPTTAAYYNKSLQFPDD